MLEARAGIRLVQTAGSRMSLKKRKKLVEVGLRGVVMQRRKIIMTMKNSEEREAMCTLAGSPTENVGLALAFTVLLVTVPLVQGLCWSGDVRLSD